MKNKNLKKMLSDLSEKSHLTSEKVIRIDERQLGSVRGGSNQILYDREYDHTNVKGGICLLYVYW